MEPSGSPRSTMASCQHGMKLKLLYQPATVRLSQSSPVLLPTCRTAVNALSSAILGETFARTRIASAYLPDHTGSSREGPLDRSEPERAQKNEMGPRTRITATMLTLAPSSRTTMTSCMQMNLARRTISWFASCSQVGLGSHNTNRASMIAGPVISLMLKGRPEYGSAGRPERPKV